MTTSPKADEKKFNETLRRMLKTPPKPHDHTGEKPKGKSEQKSKKEKPAK